MVAGLGLFAALVGSLTNMFSRGDLRFREFAEQVERVNAYMAEAGLPEELRQRVRSCYEYQFATGAVNATSSELLSDLPSYLYNEVLVSVNREVIAKVPLFNKCQVGFISALVPFLKPQAVLPGDALIREGTVAAEMYFIRTGSVEVLDKAGEALAVLGEGSYIGEIALLFREKRNATVRALAFSSLFMLSKFDFDQVAAHFPEDLESMMRIAALRKRNTTDKHNSMGLGGAARVVMAAHYWRSRTHSPSDKARKRSISAALPQVVASTVCAAAAASQQQTVLQRRRTSNAMGTLQLRQQEELDAVFLAARRRSVQPPPLDGAGTAPKEASGGSSADAMMAPLAESGSDDDDDDDDDDGEGTEEEEAAASAGAGAAGPAADPVKWL